MPRKVIVPQHLRLIAASYLYAFHCDGFHKIGISINVETRRMQIQAMNPHPVSLVLYRRIRPGLIMELEAETHRRLARHRVHGEWFKADLKTIRVAVKAAWKEIHLRRRALLEAA